ncbi:organic hydroperoxide resistance protein [Nocardia huaxiensis]|uniref:Organic hydroperoxide resistance protein n=1 Tax=Nocardia huaxiensis TaxID=2755382 RepID=A0A7D6VD28_9NOCA|nr:organic hydroperoxide resistance protein [Nocardia huaxiensis]QLY33632.1 organic hydroperoxide resistance protein [Nocardia huaxiensis]UFS99452.1 organic hydroperoxide resistance protein [Nocardia huaxiensis]
MTTLFTSSATSVGREGRSVSSDGYLDLKLAQPKAVGGTGDGTNPEQLFAMGYSACFASALQVVARTQKADLGDTSVTADVSLNKDDETGFGISVVLRVELPEHLQNETGRALVEAAHQVCPYSKATRGNIPVELVVE